MLFILRGLLLASLLILNMSHCAVYNKLKVIEENFFNRLQQIHGSGSIETVPESVESTESSDILAMVPEDQVAIKRLPLSSDILFVICGFLDVKSLINFSSTCKEVSIDVCNFSKCRVSRTNRLYAFDLPWINLLILSIVYEFDLPEIDSTSHDQLYLLLFKFLHLSANVNDPMYRSAISFIFRSIQGLNSVSPVTQKQWRKSIIKYSYLESLLPLAITAFIRHYQAVCPGFTENFDEWLNMLEFMANKPDRSELMRIRNIRHSRGHYLQEDMDEDFREIIDELATL